MITEIPHVYLNGELLTGAIEVYYDHRRHSISLWVPSLEAATRLLTDVERGVSLDHVMNNWSRQ